MSSLVVELRGIADELLARKTMVLPPEVDSVLETVLKCANEIGKSSSNSWLGYHANVYYTNFETPPIGNYFSFAWGSLRAPEGWLEVDFDDVTAMIYESAPDGRSILETSRKKSNETRPLFIDKQQEVVSILQVAIAEQPDKFLEQLLEDVKAEKITSQKDFLSYSARPTGQFVCHDEIAASQGIWCNLPDYSDRAQQFAQRDRRSTITQASVTSGGTRTRSRA